MRVFHPTLLAVAAIPAALALQLNAQSLVERLSTAGLAPGPHLSAPTQPQSNCVDINGSWSAQESGTLTCKLTAQGLSETETDPFSGTGTVDIRQQPGECTFEYDPVFPNGSAFRPGRRSGTISGNQLTVTGILAIEAPGVPGVNITTNTMQASGQVQGGTAIHLTVTGRLVGTVPGDGGVQVNLDCTANSTATLTRSAPPSGTPGAPVLGSQSVVNGASFRPGTIAPDSWVDVFGENLAAEFLLDGAFPNSLGGTTLVITDSLGTAHRARLHFVSQDRVQFLAPSGLAPGPGTLKVTNHIDTSTTVAIEIARVAPGLFSANASGQGPAAATYLRTAADGSRTEDYTFTLDAPPGRRNVPIDLSVEGDEIYVSFFGTGFRSQTTTRLDIGGIAVPVLGAVAQSQFEGLDQLVAGPLPRDLAGRGDVEVRFIADNQAANVVTIGISANGADPCSSSIGYRPLSVVPNEARTVSRVTGFASPGTPALTYVITNPNDFDANPIISADVDWISFGSTSMPGAAISGAGSQAISVFLNDSLKSLPAGEHRAIVTFATQECGVQQQREIIVQVTEDPGASWSFFGDSCATGMFTACVAMNVRTTPKNGPGGRVGTVVEIWTRNLDGDHPLETTPWGSAVFYLRLPRSPEMPQFSERAIQAGRVADFRTEGPVGDFVEVRCPDPDCQRVHCPDGPACELYAKEPWNVSIYPNEIIVQGGGVHGCPVEVPQPNAFTWVGGDWWTCRQRGWDGWVVVSFETQSIWDAEDLTRPSWYVAAPPAQPSIFQGTQPVSIGIQ